MISASAVKELKLQKKKKRTSQSVNELLMFYFKVKKIAH